MTPDRVDVIQDREGVNEITLVTCEDAAATYRTIVKGNLEPLLTMTRLQKTSWTHSVSLIIKCNFKKIKPKAEMVRGFFYVGSEARRNSCKIVRDW